MPLAGNFDHPCAEPFAYCQASELWKYVCKANYLSEEESLLHGIKQYLLSTNDCVLHHLIRDQRLRASAFFFRSSSYKVT